MAAYLIVDCDLTDPDLYEQYKLRAKPLVERFGGKYLARGGNISRKEDDLWAPKRVVLVEFESAERAESFYESPEYQEVLKISKQSARRTAFILQGA